MTAARRKTDRLTPLRDILREALKASGMDVDLELYRLWEQWTDLVGPAIAKNAHPVAIKKTLLLVNVSSAPWMQQLQYLKNELMEKLNSALGREAVKDIRFKIGQFD